MQSRVCCLLADQASGEQGLPTRVFLWRLLGSPRITSTPLHSTLPPSLFPQSAFVCIYAKKRASDKPAAKEMLLEGTLTTPAALQAVEL